MSERRKDANYCDRDSRRDSTVALWQNPVMLVEQRSTLTGRLRVTVALADWQLEGKHIFQLEVSLIMMLMIRIIGTGMADSDHDQ